VVFVHPTADVDRTYSKGVAHLVFVGHIKAASSHLFHCRDLAVPTLGQRKPLGVSCLLLGPFGISRVLGQRRHKALNAERERVQHDNEWWWTCLSFFSAANLSA